MVCQIGFPVRASSGNFCSHWVFWKKEPFFRKAAGQCFFDKYEVSAFWSLQSDALFWPSCSSLGITAIFQH
jgi:hypothetical protein